MATKRISSTNPLFAPGRRSLPVPACAAPARARTFLFPSHPLALACGTGTVARIFAACIFACVLRVPRAEVEDLRRLASLNLSQSLSSSISLSSPLNLCQSRCVCVDRWSSWPCGSRSDPRWERKGERELVKGKRVGSVLLSERGRDPRNTDRRIARHGGRRSKQGET